VRGASNDAGTTMLEVMVVVAMVGVLTAIAVWRIQEWATASAFKGAPQQVQSVLRTTQQRAITEGVSFCVEFDTTTDEYAVFRFACTDTGRVKTAGPFGTGSDEVHLSEPEFMDASGVTHGVTFSPRGSASPGQVAVVRNGVSRMVHVEGMTGRVSAD
jgi:type II secretory pathway pseudopilin PulG